MNVAPFLGNFVFVTFRSVLKVKEINYAYFKFFLKKLKFKDATATKWQRFQMKKATSLLYKHITQHLTQTKLINKTIKEHVAQN